MVTDGEHPLTHLGMAPQAARGSDPQTPSLAHLSPTRHSREEKQSPESQDLGKRSSRRHPELTHSPRSLLEQPVSHGNR